MKPVSILSWLLLVLVPLVPAPAGASDDASTALHALFDAFWEYELRESPLLATSYGRHDYDDRLGRVGPAEEDRRAVETRLMLEDLERLQQEQLGPTERINADLLARELRNRLEEHRFGTFATPVSQRWGPQVYLPRLAERVPLRTGVEYRRFLKRLRAMPESIDGTMELLRDGMRRDFVPPRVTLEGVLDQIDTHLVSDPTQSLLYEAFAELPDAIPAEAQEEIRREAAETIQNEIVPAFRRFRKFLAEEYIPACRESIACRDLPGGAELYRHRVRMYTTTSLSPQAIHDLGLREVARIKAEMLAVIEDVGFEGDFAAFVQHLRTDPRFYYESPGALLAGYRDICKRMDAELPRLFGTLPRAPYGVKEIPAFEAPRTTTAYYQPAAADGSRPGFFFANTYDLKSRPKYEMEALAFHEAMPGHHLQIALQQELTDVPQFRRNLSYTAFVEGWGLYSEVLGKEVGFYTDPYSEFGRLSYEMWRALRLVVDTGIHYFGWGRDQAIEYMLANSALTRTNVEAEVDRYISWPGQALAYKVGQLTILEIRAACEKELGERFDIRAFHDALLENGAIPLDLLRAHMEQWRNSQKGEK